MKMRSKFCLLALFSVTASSGMGIIYAEPNLPTPVIGSSPSGLQLTAQFEGTDIHVGDIVLLKVTVKNISNQTSYLLETQAPVDEFRIAVTDAGGHGVPVTLWGSAHKDQPQATHFNMVFSRIFAPGQEVTYQFILNRQFDMSLGGKYSVIVTRPHVANRDGKSVTSLVSNSASIMLLEPDPKIVNPENVMRR